MESERDVLTKTNSDHYCSRRYEGCCSQVKTVDYKNRASIDKAQEVSCVCLHFEPHILKSYNDLWKYYFSSIFLISLLLSLIVMYSFVKQFGTLVEQLCFTRHLPRFDNMSGNRDTCNFQMIRIN